MCKTNTPTTVCNKPLSTIINGKGYQTRIPWCEFTDRRIYQIASACRLTPDNIATQLYTDPVSGSQHSVYDLITREVHCYFPQNEQFGNTVRPKLLAHVSGLMKKLDRIDVIVIFKRPGGGRRDVYWPPYTRGWAVEGWDGDFGGTVKGLGGGERRGQLERIEQGDDVPGWLEGEDDAQGQQQQQNQHQPHISLPPDPLHVDRDDNASVTTESTVFTTATSIARHDALIQAVTRQVEINERERAAAAQSDEGRVRHGPTLATKASREAAVQHWQQQLQGQKRYVGTPGQGTSNSAKRRRARRAWLAANGGVFEGSET